VENAGRLAPEGNRSEPRPPQQPIADESRPELTEKFGGRDRQVVTVATLVLGDDQVVFLDALATVLTQHEHTVGAVTRSTAEMVAFVHHERPDACLIARHLARDDDVEAIGRVIAASKRTNVLVLSADPGADAVGRALDAGASGYLHQSRGVDALVAALERMLCGEVVVNVPSRPARRLSRPDQAEGLAALLTCRERQCLLMLVEGLDTAAMVARLGVSRTTVRTHLQAVLTKLGVHSRLEAASFAVRYGLPDAWSGDRLADSKHGLADSKHGLAGSKTAWQTARYARSGRTCPLRRAGRRPT
jgi:two-component system nitrate/nitrite response regulator NarL